MSWAQHKLKVIQSNEEARRMLILIFCKWNIHVTPAQVTWYSMRRLNSIPASLRQTIWQSRHTALLFCCHSQIWLRYDWGLNFVAAIDVFRSGIFFPQDCKTFVFVENPLFNEWFYIQDLFLVCTKIFKFEKFKSLMMRELRGIEGTSGAAGIRNLVRRRGRCW